MNVVQVSVLTAQIKQALDKPVFQNIAVEGEVSNFKHHSSGHMYFSLKDSHSKIKAVMFRSRNQRLTFTPRDGDVLVAVGSVGVYEPNGEYQLYVDLLLPQGTGALHIAFEQLKEKLQQEGIFDPEHKRPLPFLPRCVAVVTSPTGAAVRDIISVIRRRYPSMHILVVPAQVQGEAAPASLIQGIKLAGEQDDVNVVIIGRGGGSFEELSAFNDEDLARAIYNCPVPVISAVGHETDFTIADFAADFRAPTPSAAAEHAVPVYSELADRIDELSDRLQDAVCNRIRGDRRYLAQLTTSSSFARPTDGLRQLRVRVDELWSKIAVLTEHRVALNRSSLGALSGKLEALSPLTTLSRGYSICEKLDGQVVKGISQVEPGEQVRVRLHQGTLLCTAEGGKQE